MEDTVSVTKKQFKKVWSNGLETFYVKFNNDILTKDGILIKQSLFDNMRYQDYNTYCHTTKEKYDYAESIRNKKLTKHGIAPQKTKKKTKKKIKDTPKTDYFMSFTKIIMSFLVIGSCILSIYYTGIHMTEVSGSVFVGFLISTIMYLYGLIGSNFAVTIKKRIASFLISFTSICTIAFSMCTSLLVNGDRYFANKIQIEQSLKDTDLSNGILIETINEQIEQKRQLIQWYMDDTEKYNENHTAWESSGASKTTKENMDNLNREITELQNRKMSLIEKTPSNEEHINSFSDLLYDKLHIDGNFIRLFLLLFASIFIDIIGPLCLYIVRHRE